MGVSVPSQCSKSYVRGRRQGRPVKKCDKKYGGEWCPEKSRTSRGRKRGRPPGSVNKSTTSFPSPIRKSVKVSIKNREQLKDTDKRIGKEVSTINVMNSQFSRAEGGSRRDN